MKLLAIDGGGLFGVAPAYVLSRVGDLSKFDMFVGTSIGSMLAAQAALGTITDETVQMFLTEGREIFQKGWRERLQPWRTPRYSDKGLNRLLREHLPGRLDELSTPFVAASVNMNRRRLKIFSSLDCDDQSWDLWQVCRMSAAAQTYFSPWKGYSDGAPMANNPVMVGIREAVKEMGAKLEDIEVLSLGTGEDDSDHSVGTTVGWPIWRWAFWLIPAMLEGAGSTMHSEFARALPLKRFTRLEFDRDPKWRMDDPTVPAKLLNATHDRLEEFVKVVRDF